MWRRKAAAVAAGAALIVTPTLVSIASPAGAAIPATGVGSATVVPIQVTGDVTKRFNLVIMGDGYTEAELPKFMEQVDKHLNVMWSIEPYKSYRNYMNVYAIPIVSGESGVSCDSSLTSPRRTTPLSMAFWGGCSASSVQRLVTMNNTKANEYANLVTGSTSSNRQILALANSDTYGGAGGTYATATGGNAMSALISPHEIGHSLGGLQDEYDYYTRGVPGGAYTGGEPSSVHHTLLTEQQMRDQQKKWWRWLGEESESGGVIGRYEGGLYFTTKVWRPSKHSIMKSLGFYYDQVSREVMVQKISAKLKLVQANTPTTGSVAGDSVVWVETLHPVSHDLEVTWALDGTIVTGTNNSRNLDLKTLNLSAGTHTLTATVVDPTDFVRDPAIRNSTALTQKLTWTVDTALTTTPSATPVAFTSSTATSKPVGARDVVYAETSHPADHALKVSWKVDGAAVTTQSASGTLDLKPLRLASGTHTITATVTDPTQPGESQTLTWTVDATLPTATYAVSQPHAVVEKAGQPTEYFFNGPFTMKIDATDDKAGYVVAEYRVDGDGWQNYYGWPTSSEAPMYFTENGTNIDDLIYGKLGKGRHTIEYRGIDAAGNIGEAKKFVVNLLDGGNNQVITADVLGGALSVSFTGSTVTMPAVTLNGFDQVVNGALNAANVIDARGTAAGWDLTGQVSDFVGPNGVIVADNLGWTPAASAITGALPAAPGAGSAVVAGPVATPGVGTGLGNAKSLCHAAAGVSGGAFTCSGGLSLGIPGSTRTGTYTGVLTLTLV
jgi:hypothetical protein